VRDRADQNGGEKDQSDVFDIENPRQKHAEGERDRDDAGPSVAPGCRLGVVGLVRMRRETGCGVVTVEAIGRL